MKHKKTTDKHICTIFDSVGVAWECVTCKKPSCTRCIENTEKVVQCEDGNPDCFHGGKAACTWCGTNNWDFNPKYNKNYCNRCGYAEDYPKSKCGQCGETIYRSSHTCSKAPPEPVEDWQPAWEKLKCKTTSASIIGFENDADIKFIRNLLAQERERQKCERKHL